MQNVFELAIKNDSAELERLTQLLAPFLEAHTLPEPAVYTVELALEEMITNIIKYGYDDAAEHAISVRIEIRPSNLQITLQDDGHEFNPLTVPQPNITAPMEQRCIGGMGIYLVRQMLSGITYQRRNGVNILNMQVDLPGP